MTRRGAAPAHVVAREILTQVVRPALRQLKLHSRAAEQLVLGTAIQESLLRFREQIGGGPALGLFQMEPATHTDIWEHWVLRRPAFLALSPVDHKRLRDDDTYAAMLCRVHYHRVKAPLPPADNVEALAAYWKRYYNTPLGKGHPEEFVAKWLVFTDAHTWD